MHHEDVSTLFLPATLTIGTKDAPRHPHVALDTQTLGQRQCGACTQPSSSSQTERWDSVPGFAQRDVWKARKGAPGLAPRKALFAGQTQGPLRKIGTLGGSGGT